MKDIGCESAMTRVTWDLVVDATLHIIFPSFFFWVKTLHTILSKKEGVQIIFNNFFKVNIILSI